MQEHSDLTDIILSHSARGMDILRRYLPHDCCARCAERLLELRRGNILITTGFYVGGHAETDGPPGAFALANALSRLDFKPVIITDHLCSGFFEPYGIKTVYANADFDPEQLLSDLAPVALISTERCGKDASGVYRNMRGVDISAYTAPIDEAFLLAYSRGVYTIGIGDGGNEIGMGNLADVISNELEISPCVVPATDLIIANVSNWGCYGLCAELSRLSDRSLLPSFEEISKYNSRIVALGAVDGVTGKNTETEDGFSVDISKDIFQKITDKQR